MHFTYRGDVLIMRKELPSEFDKSTPAIVVILKRYEFPGQFWKSYANGPLLSLAITISHSHGAKLLATNSDHLDIFHFINHFPFSPLSSDMVTHLPLEMN